MEGHNKLPSAEFACLCGELSCYVDIEKHLEKHIEDGKIDGNFFCAACEYKSQNIYNFLGHCEKKYHKARSCFVQYMLLTNNLQKSYEMTKYISKISDEKLNGLRLEMKLRFGVVEGTPEENKRAMENAFLIR